MERTKLFISELDSIANAAITKLSDRHGFDASAFSVACTVRLPSDILFHVERWQCDAPRILCNASALLSLSGKPKAKARWESGALKAILGAVSMLRRSALLSPQQAIEVHAARLESRRTSVRFAPLPDRYFATTATITVTCRITGASLSGDMLPGESLEECQSRLRQALSIRILQDDETAELIDTIEQARTFRPDPAPQSVTVTDNQTTYSF